MVSCTALWSYRIQNGIHLHAGRITISSRLEPGFGIERAVGLSLGRTVCLSVWFAHLEVARAFLHLHAAGQKLVIRSYLHTTFLSVAHLLDVYTCILLISEAIPSLILWNRICLPFSSYSDSFTHSHVGSFRDL